MKGLILLVVCLGIPALFADIKTEVSTGGPSAGEVLTYSGPKARIAVSTFDVKAAKADWEIGQGLTDMIVDALFKTNRFIVLEKGDALKDLQEEFQFGQEGWAKKAPEKGTFETADIIVTGALTGFEPDYKGTGGGGVVIPLPFGVGFKVSKKEAYIAASMRLVDVRTRRVLKTAKVEGYATKSNVGVAGGGWVSGVILAGGFQKYKNEPMEKAVMAMLDQSVSEIVKGVPEDYYRYTGAEDTYQARQPVQAAAAGDEIIGGGETFKPGSKVIWEESFSKYETGDTPAGWDAKSVGLEVAEYKGKNWLRFLASGEISRKISVPSNHSLELEVYLPGISGWKIGYNTGWEISLDKSGAVKYQDQSAKSTLDKTQPHKLALAKKDGVVRIFLDGKRIYQLQEEGEIEGKTEKIQELKIAAEDVKPDEKKNCLITNIKISSYDK